MDQASRRVRRIMRQGRSAGGNFVNQYAIDLVHNVGH
ncbi:hypothetical protein N602_30345 [Mycobacterium avium subsp. hominissuis 10-5606]|nr:hypothetical protein N602_30345 [Mycobacterium avium subsp. hominissuis 10-5606]